MQGGQGQGCVLPAPGVIGSATPVVTIAAVAAALVDVGDVGVMVVVVTVVVEDDGLRFSSR